MSEPTEQVELVGDKSLSDKVEAVRRRWSSDWMSDEGVQYIFARMDIGTLLDRIAELEEQCHSLGTALSSTDAAWDDVEQMMMGDDDDV